MIGSVKWCSIAAQRRGNDLFHCLATPTQAYYYYLGIYLSSLPTIIPLQTPEPTKRNYIEIEIAQIPI